jgi:serine/threonine-protein kinase
MSGRLPYEASSLSELALKQQRELPTPLDVLNDRVPSGLARAVESALALEQEYRPTDAIRFGEAVRAGARGLGPPPGTTVRAPQTSATRVMTGGNEQTAATRVASRTGATRVAPAVAPAPRRLDARPYAEDPQAVAARAPAREAAAPKRRRGRAFALFALLLVVIGAVVAAIVIATSTAPSIVHARNIIAHDFQSAYHQLSSLISQYTK